MVEGVDARELDFQRGKMFYESASETIYVMYTDGRWESMPNTASDPPEFSSGDEVGLWIPGGVLGYHWLESTSIQSELGQSLEGQELSFPTMVQQFEGGTMLWSSDGFVYVLYSTGRVWELYPDAGPLTDAESTPEAAE